MKHLKPYLLPLLLLSLLSGCGDDAEKYDKVLDLHSPEPSDYKDCTPYTRTILLSDREIVKRYDKEDGYNKTEIIKGNNLVIYYYYSNNKSKSLKCGIVDGWYNIAVYLEFINLIPQENIEYKLPHQNIKVLYSERSADLVGPVDFTQLTGKLIVHEIDEDQITLSAFIYFPANDQNIFNFKELTFKLNKEKFYEEDEMKPFHAKK